MVMDTYKRVWTNGTTGYVTVPSHASLQPSDDYMTAEVRVYIDPKNVYGVLGGLLTKSDTSTAGLGWFISFDDRQTLLRIRRLVFCVIHGAGDAGNAFLDNAVTEAGWYHIVGTFDRTLGADNLKLFLNGVRIATANYAATIGMNAAMPVLLGSFNGGFLFQGYFAQGAVYNRALTEEEIQYNYRHPNNPKRRGLVMSLVQTSIDKPAAGTWKDVSPQTGNNGTITNATTSKYPAIRSGANALFFPTAAGSDRVDCGNGASLALTNTISIETWINTRRFNSNGALGVTVLAQKWLANVGWTLGWNPTATPYLYVYIADGFAINSVSDINLNNKWIHIVATYTGGAATGKIYINSIDKTSTSVAKALGNPATNLIVGNSSAFTNSQVGGYMSVFRLYDRVLTAAEVLYNFQHPNNPKRRGLVLNLSPESLYGIRWYDLSGNANNGTITGAIAKNLGDLTGR